MANELTLPHGARGFDISLWRKPWVASAIAAAGVITFWITTGTTPAAMAYLWQWMPALLRGFWVNIQISVLAMALGTVAGLAIGALSLSPVGAWRVGTRWYVNLFRNAPILVLIYFTTYVFPFEVRVVSWTFAFPDWLKVVLGLALPTSANVAEIFRGAIQSIPSAQWEAAQSLAFRRREIFRLIVLPQCVKRMLPPWMNVYALIAMATVQASIVGVTEMLTLTAQVHAAEGGRPELFAPLYGFALLCFFLYCYPIDRLTARLERRFETA